MYTFLYTKDRSKLSNTSGGWKKSEHGDGPISLSHAPGEQSRKDKSALPEGLQRGSEHSRTALQSALPQLGPQELITHWTCTSTALRGQLLFSRTHTHPLPLVNWFTSPSHTLNASPDPIVISAV